MDYRYYDGADDRRYCYSTSADHRCVYGDPGAVGQSDFPDQLTCAAAELAGLGVDLGHLLRRAHGQERWIESRETPGRCAACGARLEKLGYRAWVAVAIDSVDVSSLDENARSNHVAHRRLGATHWRLSDSVRRFGLRREANAWACEEAEIDRTC